MALQKQFTKVHEVLIKKKYEKFKQFLFSNNLELSLFSIELLKMNLDTSLLKELIFLFKNRENFQIKIKTLELINLFLEKELIPSNELSNFILEIKANLNNWEKEAELIYQALDLFSHIKEFDEVIITKHLHHPSNKVKIKAINLLEGVSNSNNYLTLMLDYDEEVRCEALKNLVRNPTAELIPIIIQQLINGTLKIKQTIINTLEKLESFNKLWLPLIKISISDKDVRHKSIILLGKIKDNESTDILKKEFNSLMKQTKFNPDLYLSLVQAMKFSQDLKLFPEIIQVLESPYSPCYYYAIEALIGMRPPLQIEHMDQFFDFLMDKKVVILQNFELLEKIIELLKTTPHAISILKLLEFLSDIKTVKNQIKIIELIHFLPDSKIKEFFKKIKINSLPHTTKTKLTSIKKSLDKIKLDKFI